MDLLQLQLVTTSQLAYHCMASPHSSAFLPLSIYDSVRAKRWCPTLMKIVYFLLPTWWHPKYLFNLSFNTEWTYIIRQRRITPILGLSFLILIFKPTFSCCTLFVNVSKILPILKSCHTANLLLSQLGQLVSCIFLPLLIPVP